MKFVLVLSLVLGSQVTLTKWKNVAGEWEPYRLNENQMKWFDSVHSKLNFPCCSIADGHPTDSDERPDGYYVPDPRDLTGGSPWLRVPPEAYTKPSNNPIGTAVVWYVINESSGEITIRCFVPEAKI